MATPTIFISYRREDTVGQAGRLFDRLAERFGKEHVYRDIDTIAAGEDFVEAVRAKIRRSDVMLALIGPRWLTAADAAGHRRLADDKDLVRVEIALGLERNIRVIPVLIQGATLPTAKDLPGELARLAQRNAVEVRDTAFEHDVSQLFRILEPSWSLDLFGIFVRWPAFSGLFAMGATLMGLWVYSQSALTPERARIQIVQMGMRYQADTFVGRAEESDIQAVNLFLKAGMEPDAENVRGETAAMWAAAKGNLALVKTLIDKGANGDRALVWAAGWGQKEVLDFLLARTPGKPAISAAMHNAAGTEHSDILQMLLDRGADVNFERDGSTALGAAANRLNLQNVRLLIARGANVNLRAADSRTALHEAIDGNNSADSRELEKNRIEIVKGLLSKGADISARWQYMSTRDPTPLLLAIDKEHTQIALLLIEAGSDVNAQTGDDERSMTALMWAAKEGLIEVVRALLAKGAKVNARNERDETALMIAIYGSYQRQATIALALIAGGADVNAHDKRGETALMDAAKSVYEFEEGLVEMLIANGVRINAVNNDGWTALMLAARSGRSDIVRILMRRGADINAVNHDGQTALTIASKAGRTEVVKLLGRAT